ncbi:hypothetical protein [Paenibacillus sp. OK003]|uniref:hypothetical protein n=1 Tax=Paenibacillus sp. OK003 TaxID=1884380 RepID=UPI001587D147|nr:hypothetical protein [Paenibacillus sp. OK003]
MPQVAVAGVEVTEDRQDTMEELQQVVLAAREVMPALVGQTESAVAYHTEV